MSKSLQQGNEVNLYVDNNLIGTGRLVDQIDPGLPFIISDANIVEQDQEVYRTETWNAQIINSLKPRYIKDKIYKFKFTRLDHVGIKTSEPDLDVYPTHLVDKFLKVNGKEIY